jgi:2-dehydropantoate 2-reductase
MPQKTRIGILGLGGVGGYFGGLLAAKYYHSAEAEVIFIARPATEKIIREKGLKLITPMSETIIHPDLISGNPEIIGELDFLICSVKSYDLEESLIPLSPCITTQTTILPLLNGVDAKERISKLMPRAEVLDGCVYIVSRLLEPGVVKKNGIIQSLFFGSESAPAAKLQELHKLLHNAGIDSQLQRNIQQTIWEKFLFISCLASLTTYLDLPIETVFADEKHSKTLDLLLNELSSIAIAKKITLPDNIIEKTIEKMKHLPSGTLSSMHSDFLKGAQTEYRSLTEYVSLLGDQLNIETPVFDLIVAEFREREQNTSAQKSS